MCVRVRFCLRVCVFVRERQREREKKKRKNETEKVCVCVRERDDKTIKNILPLDVKINQSESGRDLVPNFGFKFWFEILVSNFCMY